MTLLLLPFLDGITEAERSKVTFLSSSETQRRKYPMSAESQHTIHLATVSFAGCYYGLLELSI